MSAPDTQSRCSVLKVSNVFENFSATLDTQAQLV